METLRVEAVFELDIDPEEAKRLLKEYNTDFDKEDRTSWTVFKDILTEPDNLKEFILEGNEPEAEEYIQWCFETKS